MDYPDLLNETEAWQAGFQQVAGVDEVGRGPLAGPVTAAAVILNPKAIPDGLNDSKKLSAKRRESLFEQIQATSIVSYAHISVSVIDDINILNASLLAMRTAVKSRPFLSASSTLIITLTRRTRPRRKG